ncbi:DNA topoisomerase IV, B subunit, partial [mine drainage metagenome]
MPVDQHPELGRSGVEVIFTVLHAGSKFGEKIYQFSGGLHGVGVSVVNALSRRLEVWVRRGGGEFHMAFEAGAPILPLTQTGRVPRGETGTRIRFWVDPGYFENPRFSRETLIHTLRAKAVLLPGFSVALVDESTGENWQWCYEAGLGAYLREALPAGTRLPEPPFVGHF